MNLLLDFLYFVIEYFLSTKLQSFVDKSVFEFNFLVLDPRSINFKLIL
jgi:hypothetical protein